MNARTCIHCGYGKKLGWKLDCGKQRDIWECSLTAISRLEDEVINMDCRIKPDNTTDVKQLPKVTTDTKKERFAEYFKDIIDMAKKFPKKNEEIKFEFRYYKQTDRIGVVAFFDDYKIAREFEDYTSKELDMLTFTNSNYNQAPNTKWKVSKMWMIKERWIDDKLNEDLILLLEDDIDEDELIAKTSIEAAKFVECGMCSCKMKPKNAMEHLEKVHGILISYYIDLIDYIYIDGEGVRC